MSDQTACGSRIFEGFQALGLHSSHVAHATRYHKRHEEHYIFTAVGRVFHSYNCSRFGLCQVSNQHPSEIECIAADAFYVYTACENTVAAYERNRHLKRTYSGHEKPVHLILPFSEHLITVDRSSTVKVWHIETGEQYLSLEFSNSSFEITTIIHPSTYVNKVLFGSKQGSLQLWNISRNKMIYNFQTLGDSAVTALEQAPAIDVVAVGTEHGTITILNLRTDKVVMQLRQESGPVTSLSFRTDGESIMASGTASGHVYLWDLEGRKLKGKIEDAHRSAVAAITFLPGQPLLLSNSGDNSIKMWEFEKGGGVGNLLRDRAGHYRPQTKIRFYKDSSVVSAANDSTLRIFSCVHPKHDRSLGQASLNRKQARKRGLKFDEGKLPPIVDFCVETAREGQWDGVVAAHARHPLATTWNLHCSRMGAHKFIQNNEKFHKCDNNAAGAAAYYVSSVACTSCGNFCLVGYNTGAVDLYNIQSGIHRGSYVDASLKGKKAHGSAVKGIAVDALNQVMVSCGSKGQVKFWRFKTKNLLSAIETSSPPAFINLHRGNSMLVVALDDFSLTVLDLETRKVVRKFGGHSGKVNDLTWSDDGRWIVSCSSDCTIKTWDVPSVSMIDCFLVDAAVVSLALSPASDLLATTHVDDVGIYLWTNRTLYACVYLSPLPQDFHPEDALDLPSAVAMATAEEIVDVEEKMTPEEEEKEREGCGQLEEDLITLSSLPYSKWAHVLQLDNIRQRNKPKEPPKAPKSAPFFLPTVSSLNPHFAADNNAETNETASKLISSNPTEELSEFGSALLRADRDFEDVMSMFKKMSLSAIDTEIRSLAPDCGGSVALLETFLQFVEHGVSTKKDFEIIQAYFSLFLTVHAETLATIDGIEEKLVRINSKFNEDRIELSRLLNQSQCIVNYIKSATL